MVIITRRLGEVIRVGKDIEICIADIYHGEIKFAVDAPKTMTVVNEEDYQPSRSLTPILTS